METLYSKILWDELGLKNDKGDLFEINKAEIKEINKYILDWAKSTEFDNLEKVLFELSLINKYTYEMYYDGAFFGFSQNKKNDTIIIHDNNMMPTILAMAIKTYMNPNDLRLAADILDVFYERMPKQPNSEYGYKLEKGNLLLESKNKKD